MSDGSAVPPALSPIVPRHVLVLARMELRRLLPVFRRMAVMTAIGLPLLVAVGGREALPWGLLIVGLALWGQGSQQLLRDRIGGDLLVLSTLPISTETVAAAKFLAAAAPATVAAGFLAGVAGLVLPAVVPFTTPVEAAAGTFVATGIVLNAGAFLMMGLLARFRLQTLTSGVFPLVVLAGWIGMVWVADVFLMTPRAGIVWLLSQPWLPPVAIAVSLAAAGLVSWLAFRLTTAGIRGYRPEPDAISW